MESLRQGRGEAIMVSAIGGITDYSAIGSLDLLSGMTKTNETDNSFVDILSDTENDTETKDITETADEKSDLYKYIKDSMGMPAGLSVEGFEYSQSTDSAPQAASNTNSTASNSSDSESEQYDDMDLNKDGVVTADEIMRYMQMQQQENLTKTIESSLDKYSNNNFMGGLNSKNATNAYQNLSTLQNNAMTLNIAI